MLLVFFVYGQDLRSIFGHLEYNRVRDNKRLILLYLDGKVFKGQGISPFDFSADISIFIFSMNCFHLGLKF